MIRPVAIAFCLAPSLVWAGDISASNAFVPLAPKSVMAHAAYMELTNSGSETRSVVGISAPAYGMAHLHQSMEHDGVATMSAMHQLDIKSSQTVTLEPGGLHVMLMKPSAPLVVGETVALEIQFANGETLAVSAKVIGRDGSS